MEIQRQPPIRWVSVQLSEEVVPPPGRPSSSYTYEYTQPTIIFYHTFEILYWKVWKSIPRRAITSRPSGGESSTSTGQTKVFESSQRRTIVWWCDVCLTKIISTQRTTFNGTVESRLLPPAHNSQGWAEVFFVSLYKRGGDWGLGIREELVLLVSLGGQRIWKVLIDRPK